MKYSRPFFTFMKKHKGLPMKKGIFLGHLALICAFTACGGDSPSEPLQKDDSSASESSSSFESPLSQTEILSSSEIAPAAARPKVWPQAAEIHQTFPVAFLQRARLAAHYLLRNPAIRAGTLPTTTRKQAS